MVHTPGEVHSEFTRHYEALYASSVLPMESLCSDFLARVDLPHVEEEQMEALEEPLDLEEIKSSIGELASGKTPGPDGLPADFYKVFASQLAPRLLRVYEEAVQRGCYSASQREALLVSLPKPGRDPAEMGSYWPLAMLNIDKVLAKVLAVRLAPRVPDLVHQDQNGFVPARDTSHNIRQLFRVMQ
ncbi:hypothetical protein NDU88_007779 [Pleurodeles waltl]|uniref:Reverse transcriptase domain-containing protein n=1 Tax=Pleurodeles waltl TaxID=8319 RepID=A0AAV7STX3_PLEWA|nr:hypothetical protein NDU88_007779 [Pleurodeles waltl]